MSDYTDREIPVLDDIISSPVKTDALLADAKISAEPEIQANVQLDIELNDPVLNPDTHYASAHNEPIDTPHHLINTEHENNEHTGTRIEPALHHGEATETFKSEIETATDNTESFVSSTANDSLSEPIENDPNAEQNTLKEDFDDPDILPSGERLYRYVPETQAEVEPQTTDTQNNIEPPHADAQEVEAQEIDILESGILETDVPDASQVEQQAFEEQQVEQLDPQAIDDVIADTNSSHSENDFISDEPVLKTDTNIAETELSTNRDKEDEDPGDAQQNNEVTIPVSTQQAAFTEHESALIDYQTDVDPYSMDEPEEDSQTTDPVTDDTPQWRDIQQEISGIQAETSATATDNLIASTLNNLDTNALTEQVLQTILPNIEQQLRLHIKESIQVALNTSLKQINSSANNEEGPPDAWIYK